MTKRFGMGNKKVIKARDLDGDGKKSSYEMARAKGMAKGMGARFEAKKGGEWQTQTEWHDVVVWRTLAERAESVLKKGAQVYIEGKLTTRKWQDKDGNDRYTTEVVANSMKSLDRRETQAPHHRR